MSALDSIFRQLAADAPAHSHVHPLAHIDPAVQLPDDVVVQAGAYLGAGVLLEPGCRIGPNVAFVDGTAPTIVRRGVQIGANATLHAGITIAAKAVVRPGAVVSRSVLPGAPTAPIWPGSHPQPTTPSSTACMQRWAGSQPSSVRSCGG